MRRLQQCSNFLNFKIVLLSIFLSAAAPPPQILSLIHNNSFDPDDYKFARGAFSGATPQEISDWKTIQNYSDVCIHDAAIAENKKLLEIGVSASVPEEVGYSDHICMQLNMSIMDLDSFKDWNEFISSMKNSLPYFIVYKDGVNIAKSIAQEENDSPELNEIFRRYLIDQIWRRPTLGVLNRVPTISSKVYMALNNRIILETINSDWDNTVWIKNYIKKNGWKTVIDHKSYYQMLFILVQHADVSPSFQVEQLRLIKNFRNDKNFPTSDYALLTDRVMLATVHKQRFGTQLTCQNHHWMPHSLETGDADIKALDRVRGAAGLPPEAEYLKRVPAHC